MKKLKYFQKEKFQHEVRVLESKLKAYNEFLKIADRLSPGAKSMDDLVKFVNGSTGFVNPRMSANALGIFDEFNRCIELEAIWTGINYSALEPDGKNQFKIKPEHLERLEELYRVYYEDDQAKQINSLEKAIAMLNKLEMPYRGSLSYHPTQQFYFWNKTHTDSNMRRYSKKPLVTIDD